VLVVDSSVWIDFFNDADHPAVGLLSLMLDRGEVRIVVPDLVLYEVLRGFRHEADYRAAKRMMEMSASPKFLPLTDFWLNSYFSTRKPVL
jgi:predicted nucleic acid-binding protein